MFVFIKNKKKRGKRKEKEKKKKKKRKIVYKENKKFLKFQLKGVVGGVKRIAGEFEFL